MRRFVANLLQDLLGVLAERRWRRRDRAGRPAHQDRLPDDLACPTLLADEIAGEPQVPQHPVGVDLAQASLPGLSAVVGLVLQRLQHVVPVRAQPADAGEQADPIAILVETCGEECLLRDLEAKQAHAAEKPGLS